MKALTDIQTAEIKEKLTSVATKKDLVSLINTLIPKSFFKGEKEISEKQFSFYANPKISGEKRYHTFSIKKKSGGERILNSPTANLLYILKGINELLKIFGEPHEKAMGFVPEKSVVSNAQLHLGKNYVYNIDLQDFFHSFEIWKVKRLFIKKPFNFSGEREPLAYILASLCTHPMEIDGEEKYVLPQGAPTSPMLTNLLCKKMDKRLDKLAKKYGATFSRYADDISFSSNKSVFKNPEFLKELETIITENGLKINPKKTRLQKRTERQEVTGVTVNKQPNVTRRYVKQIRAWLYLMETYGEERAENIFLKDYTKEKEVKASMKWVLTGKLLYLKMVKGEQDSTYQKLAQRFDKICGFDIDEILKVWEEKGESAAEKLFAKIKYRKLNPKFEKVFNSAEYKEQSREILDLFFGENKE